MDLGSGVDKETQARFRKYMTMLDSMSEKELDEPDVRKLYDMSKMRRIACGSGCSLVRLLLGTPLCALLWLLLC
jgi:signal recognition particle subunit SRP54